MPKKASRCFSLESRTRQETIAIADENETSKQHLHETIPCLLEMKTKSQLALIKIEGIKEWEEYVSQIESSGKMRNRTDKTEEEDEHGLVDSNDEKVAFSVIEFMKTKLERKIQNLTWLGLSKQIHNIKISSLFHDMHIQASQ